MPSSPSRRAPRTVIAAGVMALGLFVAACGGDDATPEDATRADLVEQMAYNETTPENAECVADELVENLSQDELNAIYAADTEDDVTPELAQKNAAAWTACAQPGA